MLLKIGHTMVSCRSIVQEQGIVQSLNSIQVNIKLTFTTARAESRVTKAFKAEFIDRVILHKPVYTSLLSCSWKIHACRVGDCNFLISLPSTDMHFYEPMNDFFFFLDLSRCYRWSRAVVHFLTDSFLKKFIVQ